jgi:hypothetical protein
VLIAGKSSLHVGDCESKKSDKSEPPAEYPVPSLIKFLLIAGILAGIVYGGMIALVTFVEPQPREMSQSIPPARLNK